METLMKLDFLKNITTPCNIRDIPWPQHLKILVLAPHPDDFDEPADTLHFFHEKGYDIYAAVAIHGGGIDSAYAPEATLEEKREIRIEEQRKSVSYFGLPENHLRFMELINAEDEQFTDASENITHITNIINELNPDIVFCPHGNDTNRAHRLMYEIVSKIMKERQQPTALFLNRDAKTISMKNDLYFGFDEKTAIWKKTLLRLHDSQQQRNLKERGYGFDERVLMLNKNIAEELKIDEPYASVFEAQLFLQEKKETTK